jgi:hypothetical protein
MFPGSTSTYCEQFKHFKTSKLVHVLWTIRGNRPGPSRSAGASLEIYDQNDNATSLKKNGSVTFTVDQSPQYLEDLTADAEISLGESDHRMPTRPRRNRKITWRRFLESGCEGGRSTPKTNRAIERFLGKMSAKTSEAPAARAESP